jgi:uncharacterized membrane protein
MTFNQVVETIGRGIDVAGVLAIAGGIGLTVLLAGGRLRRREPDLYRKFRQEVGRAILLGLELLVAADIIRTVAVSPTLESVAVLAGIVLVRTFLSFSLEVELTGMWPWQRGRNDEADEDADVGDVKKPDREAGTPPAS